MFIELLWAKKSTLPPVYLLTGEKPELGSDPE